MVLNKDGSISFFQREIEILIRVLYRLSLGYNISLTKVICSDADIISLLSQSSRSFEFLLDSYEFDNVEKLLRVLVRAYGLDKK